MRAHETKRACPTSNADAGPAFTVPGHSGCAMSAGGPDDKSSGGATDRSAGAGMPLFPHAPPTSPAPVTRQNRGPAEPPTAGDAQTPPRCRPRLLAHGEPRVRRPVGPEVDDAVAAGVEADREVHQPGRRRPHGQPAVEVERRQMARALKVVRGR